MKFTSIDIDDFKVHAYTVLLKEMSRTFHISCTTGNVQDMPSILYIGNCIVYVALCCSRKCTGIQEFPGLGNLPEMWHILYITFTKTAPENLKFLPVYIAIYFRCVTFI